MSNPRKFSEKIALHAQKQAEGNAAFEQIMREVGVAVPKESPGTSPNPTQPMYINQSLLQPFHRSCSGSLPNVSQMAAYSFGHQQPMYQDTPGGTPGGPPGYPPDQRGSGFGPQRTPRAVCDHRRETSPYGTAGPTFLSPPADTGWRRTHSDSALHRPQQAPECYSPSLQRREVGGSGLHEVPGSGGSSPAPPPGHWNPFDPKLGHVPVSVAGQMTDQRVPGAPSVMMQDGRTPPNGLPPMSRDGDGSPPFSSSPMSPLCVGPPSPGQYPPVHSIPAQPASQNRLAVPMVVRPSNGMTGFKAASVGPLSPAGSGKYSPAGYGDDGQQQQQQPMSPDPLYDLMAAYRNPQLSPRSCSPLPFGQPGYRSPSPLDGFPSAPSSPVAPPQGSHDFYGAPHAQQMQRQFEQFNMGMSPVVSVPSGATMLSSQDGSQRSTPLTPTSSIPEITLSDFSTAGELQQQAPLRGSEITGDLLQGSSDTFDAEDLGELDLEGLQMLTNPDGHVIDASSDDYFRMESFGP